MVGMLVLRYVWFFCFETEMEDWRAWNDGIPYMGLDICGKDLCEEHGLM
jgi:hypothetical protein